MHSTNGTQKYRHKGFRTSPWFDSTPELLPVLVWSGRRWWHSPIRAQLECRQAWKPRTEPKGILEILAALPPRSLYSLHILFRDVARLGVGGAGLMSDDLGLPVNINILADRLNSPS